MSKPIEILLIEDSIDDVEFTREALSDAKLRNNLNVVYDGEAAINFLKRRKGYEDAPSIDLMLLDLNLPKKNGMEVLKEVKEDNLLKQIPTIMLTTSQADEDVLEAYRLHVNCFVSKPLDFESFISIVESIENFWFSIVKLPKNL